jgi:outer membrane immunogenic protein
MQGIVRYCCTSCACCCYSRWPRGLRNRRGPGKSAGSIPATAATFSSLFLDRLLRWRKCRGRWASNSSNDVAGAVTGVAGADLGSHTASGFIGGGQIGCDYQAGVWVFGLQGMFDGSGMEGSNTDPSSLFTINSQIPWLATVTGRVGVTAAPTVLVYAKGGGAWVRDNYTLAAVGGSTLANANTTQSGWTAGGGIEWAFAGNWTAFAEYNYFDFGTPGVMFTSADGVTTFPINIKQNINSFMVGINYRFGATGY